MESGDQPDEAMMEQIMPFIGGAAAILASLSYIPQVRKTWRRNSTHDLSLNMLIALTTGLILWVVYGFLREDWIIATANSVGATLSGSVLAFKLRDMFGW